VILIYTSTHNNGICLTVVAVFSSHFGIAFTVAVTYPRAAIIEAIRCTIIADFGKLLFNIIVPEKDNRNVIAKNPAAITTI
jgi:hypothetical protein